MPVPNTKYNYVNIFQKDLSNSSFQNSRSNHIITCDPSDTFIEDGEPYRVYLGSKASFLIHPFSQVSNCKSNINNSNSLFRIKIPDSIHIDPSSTIQTQKKIQKQTNPSSTLYTMNLAALSVNNENLSKNTLKGPFNASDRKEPHGLKAPLKNTSIKPNHGIDIKHNSYDRYLARKKSQYLKTEQINNNIQPLYGNKTRKYGLVFSNNINCNKTC